MTELPLQTIVDGAYADIDQRNEQLAALGLAVRIVRTLMVEPVVVPEPMPTWDEGYTGSICPTCKSPKMRRNGTCERCDNCGTTTGC